MGPKVVFFSPLSSDTDSQCETCKHSVLEISFWSRCDSCDISLHAQVKWLIHGRRPGIESLLKFGSFMKPHCCSFVCLVSKKKKQHCWTHLTGNKKDSVWHQWTKKPTEAVYIYSICLCIIQLFSQTVSGYMTARGMRRWAEKRMMILVRGVRLILCDKVGNSHAPHWGSLYHARGVFLMLKSGLASRMHTIYARKKRRVSSTEGLRKSSLGSEFSLWQKESPWEDQGKRAFNRFSRTVDAAYSLWHWEVVENNG